MGHAESYRECSFLSFAEYIKEYQAQLVSKKRDERLEKISARFSSPATNVTQRPAPQPTPADQAGIDDNTRGFFHSAKQDNLTNNNSVPIDSEFPFFDTLQSQRNTLINIVRANLMKIENLSTHRSKKPWEYVDPYVTLRYRQSSLTLI